MKSQIENILLPSAVDLEEQLLVTCILDSGIASRVAEALTPGDFYKTKHAVIMQAICELNEKDQPVELPTIAEQIRLANKSDAAGGAAGLAQMIDSIPGLGSSSSVDFAIKRIKETAVNRTLYIEINKMMQDSPNRTSSANIGILEALIARIERDEISPESIKPLCDMTTDWNEAFEKNARGEMGIETGFATIDQMTGGLKPQTLIVLAARPSVGKSALAVNILHNIVKDNIPAVLFSLEMPHAQIGARLVAAEGLLNLQRFIRPGQLPPDKWAKVTEALGRLHDLPLYIETKPQMHYQNIIRGIRYSVNKFGVQLAVIDYLGLMTGDIKQKSKTLELAVITAALKNLAIHLKIPILLLVQMNRAIELRAEKEPMLSDLRDSGNIEQDADIVMFLGNLPDPGKPGSFLDGIKRLTISKNRSGPTGYKDLRFDGKYTLFSDPPGMA